MFEEILARLAKALDRAKINYMVIGGQALLRYGEPRLTKDIDITLGLSPDQAAPALKCIDQLGFKVLVDDTKDFLSKTFVLPVQDPKSGIRIDIIFSLSEYEKEALQRSRPLKIKGTTVYFISPEDLVIHKVVAGRARDLEDVKNLLLKVKELDLEMIRSWLQQYDAELGEGFEHRLDQILCSIR